MGIYKHLKWRGFIKDVSHEDKAKELLANENVRFYCGFDPTGESLTVGHMVQIVRMMVLEQLGHTPVVVIGGGTGLIGDPKQTGERKLLNLETSLENSKKIEQQIRRFLPNAIYVNNYDWLKDIDLITFLRDYGKDFNVNYMLAKENVSSRLETGISFTEFTYMILQSIDWLYLYENYNVKMQFGGSDQWGNITSGLELIRKKHENHSAVGMASPLLLKSDGTKFGKSESGALWLDENLTSPYELYQYFLNTADDDVDNFLKMLTTLKEEEIVSVLNESQEKPELRVAQKVLASEIVKLVHGEKALQEALNITDSLFNATFDQLSEKEFDIAAKSLDSLIVKEEIGILNALSQTNLAQSNREARTFISSGAVLVNDKKITDLGYYISKEDAYFNKYVVLRRGKKRYSIIQFEY